MFLLLCCKKGLVGTITGESQIGNLPFLVFLWIEFSCSVLFLLSLLSLFYCLNLLSLCLSVSSPLFYTSPCLSLHALFLYHVSAFIYSVAFFLWLASQLSFSLFYFLFPHSLRVCPHQATYTLNTFLSLTFSLLSTLSWCLTPESGTF